MRKLLILIYILLNCFIFSSLWMCVVTVSAKGIATVLLLFISMCILFWIIEGNYD